MSHNYAVHHCIISRILIIPYATSNNNKPSYHSHRINLFFLGLKEKSPNFPPHPRMVPGRYWNAYPVRSADVWLFSPFFPLVWELQKRIRTIPNCRRASRSMIAFLAQSNICLWSRTVFRKHRPEDWEFPGTKIVSVLKIAHHGMSNIGSLLLQEALMRLGRLLYKRTMVKSMLNFFWFFV